MDSRIIIMIRALPQRSFFPAYSPDNPAGRYVTSVGPQIGPSATIRHTALSPRRVCREVAPRGRAGTVGGGPPRMARGCADQRPPPPGPRVRGGAGWTTPVPAAAPRLCGLRSSTEAALRWICNGVYSPQGTVEVPWLKAKR